MIRPADESTRPKLPRAVVAFGVVSLLTDASSEMIYPLLPRFLTVVLGASVTFVGTVEGIAESTAALLKLVAGVIADRAPRKKPLTTFGYGLSSAVRPLVAVAVWPWNVLVIRFLDRVGKGLRTTPRDTILAEATPPEIRGRSFGFHRAMDNAGAVLGPILATVALAAFHLGLRWTFALSAIPAALAMTALVFFVREPAAARPPAHRGEVAAGMGARVRDAIGSLRLTPALGRYFLALALFTLANSSDAFLLLLATRRGVREALIPVLWLALSAVRMLAATPGGILSDRFGRRRLLVAGWLLYALVYAGFALSRTAWHIWALFAVYGIYYGLVEGTERALVADLAPAPARGRAFGGYNFVVGLLAFPASELFGIVWKLASPEIAFAAAAGLAAAATVTLRWLVPAKLDSAV